MVLTKTLGFEQYDCISCEASELNILDVYELILREFFHWELFIPRKWLEQLGIV